MFSVCVWILTNLRICGEVKTPSVIPFAAGSGINYSGEYLAQAAQAADAPCFHPCFLVFGRLLASPAKRSELKYHLRDHFPTPSNPLKPGSLPRTDQVTHRMRLLAVHKPWPCSLLLIFPPLLLFFVVCHLSEPTYRYIHWSQEKKYDSALVFVSSVKMTNWGGLWLPHKSLVKSTTFVTLL